MLQMCSVRPHSASSYIRTSSYSFWLSSTNNLSTPNCSNVTTSSFTVCALQLFQFLFQRLAQLFQLLYCEMLANLCFRFFDGLLDFIHLFLNQTLLSFCGQGYLFKLAVSDDNRIIITGRNSRTEFFRLPGSKSFLLVTSSFALGYRRKNSLAHCSVKWFGTTKKTFLTQAQTFQFHSAEAAISKLLPAPTSCAKRVLYPYSTWATALR